MAGLTINITEKVYEGQYAELANGFNRFVKNSTYAVLYISIGGRRFSVEKPGGFFSPKYKICTCDNKGSYIGDPVSVTGDVLWDNLYRLIQPYMSSVSFEKTFKKYNKSTVVTIAELREALNAAINCRIQNANSFIVYLGTVHDEINLYFWSEGTVNFDVTSNRYHLYSGKISLSQSKEWIDNICHLLDGYLDGTNKDAFVAKYANYVISDFEEYKSVLLAFLNHNIVFPFSVFIKDKLTRITVSPKWSRDDNTKNNIKLFDIEINGTRRDEDDKMKDIPNDSIVEVLCSLYVKRYPEEFAPVRNQPATVKTSANQISNNDLPGAAEIYISICPSCESELRTIYEAVSDYLKSDCNTPLDLIGFSPNRYCVHTSVYDKDAFDVDIISMIAGKSETVSRLLNSEDIFLAIFYDFIHFRDEKACAAITNKNTAEISDYRKKFCNDSICIRRNLYLTGLTRGLKEGFAQSLVTDFLDSRIQVGTYANEDMANPCYFSIYKLNEDNCRIDFYPGQQQAVEVISCGKEELYDRVIEVINRICPENKKVIEETRYDEMQERKQTINLNGLKIRECLSVINAAIDSFKCSQKTFINFIRDDVQIRIERQEGTYTGIIALKDKTDMSFIDEAELVNFVLDNI